MEIFYVLLVILVVTRTFGELAVRLKQPALVGELISGTLLGVLVHVYADTFPILSGIEDDEVFIALTDLGVFFLMLLAGIEMHPRELAEKSRDAFLIALGGMALPLAFGIGLGWFALPASEYRSAQILFLGVAMAVTAVPVAVKVLSDLGKLNTRVGQIIVSAAIFDDVLSLILLAALTALIQTGEVPGATALLFPAVKVIVFFLITSLVGRYILPTLGKVIKRRLSEEMEFTALLVVGFSFAVLAELLGMHFILGAFVAGLFFSGRTITPKIYKDVKRKVSGLTNGFLAPIFFASIGLHLSFSAVTEVPLFLALLIVLALAGKLLGAGIPALIAGLSRRNALRIGVAMSSRGAVELIIAGIALQAGLFDYPDPPPPIIENMFSAVVIMAIVTTLITPIGLRWLLHDDE